MWGKRTDMRVHEQDPYNAEPPPYALAQGMVTDLDSFYVRSHGPVPELDPDGWRLRVEGEVGERLDLDLEGLQEGFEQVRSLVTLQCAGNRRDELIEVRDIPGEDPWGSCATSTAWWTGVRLRDVLERAGHRAPGAHVAFEAPDMAERAVPPQPYGSSIPLERALEPDVLLAWSMNDKPLPAVHGAPLRVVVPGWIGARSVKWLRRVTVQQQSSDNYFQATAYRLLAPQADPDAAGPGDGISLGAVALSSAVLAPDPGSGVVAGPVEVAGYAHAGHGRHAARVDVSLDGGTTWVQAELGEQVDGAWRLWRVSLDLPAGSTRVTARAWDSTGASQPESSASLWNPKGYANNAWSHLDVQVR